MVTGGLPRNWSDFMIIGLLSILAILFVMPPPPVGAERVWDSDLKRYLTEQEMNIATVYLQEE